jgi:hypothetical protein
VAALQAKKASGAKLGNPTNLCIAGSIERNAQAQVAGEFAANLMPVVQAIQNAGAEGISEREKAIKIASAGRSKKNFRNSNLDGLGFGRKLRLRTVVRAEK